MDLFAACDLKDLDIGLLQNSYSNRSIFGIVLMEGGECSLRFSYFSEFNPKDKLVKSGIGYLCVFEELFLSGALRKRILELPMFARGSGVEYILSEEDHENTRHLFEKMIFEQDSPYQYKFDLIRTYLTQMLHLVMKMG